jgi:hypothetical protein
MLSQVTALPPLPAKPGPGEESPLSLPPVGVTSTGWNNQVEEESTKKQPKPQRIQKGDKNKCNKRQNTLTEKPENIPNAGKSGKEIDDKDLEVQREAESNDDGNRKEEVLNDQLNEKEGRVPALKLYLKGIGEEVKALSFTNLGKLDLRLGRSATRQIRARSESRGRISNKDPTKSITLFSTLLKFPNNPFSTPSKELNSLEKNPRLARGSKRDKSITPTEAIHTDVKRPNNDPTEQNNIKEKLSDSLLDKVDDNPDHYVFGIVKMQE